MAKKKEKKPAGFSVTAISIEPRGLPLGEASEPPTSAKDSVIRKNAISRIMKHLLEGGLFDSEGKA